MKRWTMIAILGLLTTATACSTADPANNAVERIEVWSIAKTATLHMTSGEVIALRAETNGPPEQWMLWGLGETPTDGPVGRVGFTLNERETKGVSRGWGFALVKTVRVTVVGSDAIDIPAPGETDAPLFTLEAFPGLLNTETNKKSGPFAPYTYTRHRG